LGKPVRSAMTLSPLGNVFSVALSGRMSCAASGRAKAEEQASNEQRIVQREEVRMVRSFAPTALKVQGKGCQRPGAGADTSVIENPRPAQRARVNERRLSTDPVGSELPRSAGDL